MEADIINFFKKYDLKFNNLIEFANFVEIYKYENIKNKIETLNLNDNTEIYYPSRKYTNGKINNKKLSIENKEHFLHIKYKYPIILSININNIIDKKKSKNLLGSIIYYSDIYNKKKIEYKEDFFRIRKFNELYY